MYNKPGLILVRFDKDEKPVEYKINYRGFAGATPIGSLLTNFSGDSVSSYSCIAAEDNIMQRWERKNDIPFGTAYSFEDFEPTLKTKGDLFWNWQYGIGFMIILNRNIIYVRILIQENEVLI